MGKSLLVAASVVLLMMVCACPAWAQYGDPFAHLEYGAIPGCPFDCDSVTLRLAGELTSTAWKAPVLTGWNRVGDSITVFVNVEFAGGVALPVTVPFELLAPLGPLPQGAYRVIYLVSVISPATIPTIPIVVTDGFRVAPPGDQTCDGVVDVRDVIRLLNYVFRDGSPPDPWRRGDVNCDGTIDVSDVIALILHVFCGGDICDPCEGGSLLPFVIITNQPPGSLKRDPFELLAAEVAGDTLKLTLAHSGGCMDHAFAVYMTPAMFSGPVPRQALLYPQHIDPGDPCDAWVTENLQFDLRPVALLYLVQYHRLDDIMLQVRSYDQTTAISVLYHPQ